MFYSTASDAHPLGLRHLQVHLGLRHQLQLMPAREHDVKFVQSRAVAVLVDMPSKESLFQYDYESKILPWILLASRFMHEISLLLVSRYSTVRHRYNKIRSIY